MDKKIAIGIRVTPSIIFYSIIQENEEDIDISIVDKLIIPVALSVPERLKFIRNTFLDIIYEFNISLACIRITESTAQSPDHFRIQIEGVIQELFASSSITKYFAGQISNISSRLKFERDQFKEYAKGKIVFNKISNWTSYNLENRESILAAFSGLTLFQ